MLNRDGVFCALALAMTLAVGCGSSDTSDTSGGGGEGGTTSSSETTDSTTESTTTSSSTTGAGGGLTCENEEGVVVAVSELSFGDGASGEWKKLGFDIDGKESTSISMDLCQLNTDASSIGPYPDGDGGIDNSFGKNLLPLILSLYPTWVSDINAGILDGYFTSLMKMECLPPTGDVAKFNSKLFGGTTLDTPPKFDGTDKWPVAPELLSDPMDPLSSTVNFDNSSVVGAQFDTGTGGTFILTVPLKTQTASTTIKLTLYSARVTMTLSEDRKSATGGVIGGVLNTEELVAEIRKVGVLLDLCGTDVFENILDEVRRASDILSDGTQDTEKTCDGISIGLGFEMKPAQIGEVGPESPVEMACP